MIPHILTNQSLTVLLDGRSIAIPRSHANFDAIIECLADVDDGLQDLRQLIDVKQSVADFMQGKIEIHDRVLTYGGKELDTGLTRKIIEFMREGEPDLAGPLVNFLDKVMLNPSRRAVQGLYDWVAASKMPIAPDGDIYAWKIVNADYLDYYTKTLDHTPGNVVSQPRNQCDEDPDSTCSYGIHFCSFDYLPHYHSGDDSRRVMLVKIDPADVVAIPRDYNTAKGRCCKLTVVQQVPQEAVETFFPTRTVYVPTAYDSDANYQGFAVGQVWFDSDSDKLTVINVDVPNGVITCELGYDGSQYQFDLDGDEVDGGYLRLIRLIDEPKFELDQVWLDNDGDELTIVEVNENGVCAEQKPLGVIYWFRTDGSPFEDTSLRLVRKVR